MHAASRMRRHRVYGGLRRRDRRGVCVVWSVLPRSTVSASANTCLLPTRRQADSETTSLLDPYSTTVVLTESVKANGLHKSEQVLGFLLSATWLATGVAIRKENGEAFLRNLSTGEKNFYFSSTVRLLPSVVFGVAMRAEGRPRYVVVCYYA